jgi:DNA polymerase
VSEVLPHGAAAPNDPSSDELDPRDELLALVEGLSAHVSRRQRLGLRAIELPPQPSAAARAASGPAPTTPAKPSAAPGAPPFPAPGPAPLPAASRGPLTPGSAIPPTQKIAPDPSPEKVTAPRAPAGVPRPQPAPVAPPSATTSLPEAVARNRAAAAACGDLASLARAVAACTACELCKTRKQTVFSDGDGSAGVLFIGEAPGANEDEQGLPFVGAAGQLLSDIIHKGMKLERSRVSIANVLKCRPPGNREPTDAEKALCTPWLDRQVELLAPRVIVALGRHAGNHMLGYAGAARQSLAALRGRVHERAGRKVVVTYHPANLLREPDNKKDCWKDIQLAMAEIGLQPPARGA